MESNDSVAEALAALEAKAQANPAARLYPTEWAWAGLAKRFNWWDRNRDAKGVAEEQALVLAYAQASVRALVEAATQLLGVVEAWHPDTGDGCSVEEWCQNARAALAPFAHLQGGPEEKADGYGTQK